MKSFSSGKLFLLAPQLFCLMQKKAGNMPAFLVLILSITLSQALL